MATTPPTPPAAPTVPDRSDQTTFPLRMYNAFVYLFGDFWDWLDDASTNVYDNAVLAATSETNAATSASNASTSETNAAASAASAVAAPGTSATSTTSLTVGLGSQSLTIQTGKSIVVGASVVLAYTTTPTTRMIGTVTSYTSGTGALVVDVTAIEGSGTYAAWTVSLTAAHDTDAYARRNVQIKWCDDLTLLTTGDGKAIFVVPADLDGFRLVDADAFVTTVSSSGTPTIQLRNVTDAVDMLSTRITIDVSEYTSWTAATAPVINTSNATVTTGDLIAIDVDVTGTGTKGGGVALVFQKVA